MINHPSSLEHQLRSTVIISGDCAPDAVGHYLKDAARRGSDGAKQQIYNNFASLIKTVPVAYADFLLEILLQRQKPTNSSIAGPSLDDEDEFDNSADHFAAFYHDYDLDAPAYNKGPFLYLLRRDEDEGLRFLWTYSNTLVNRWKHRVTHPQGYSKYNTQAPRTPLPLKLELPSQTLSFWGDEPVYLWPHDQNRYQPRPLVSALLALEYWMEEQIESGRDAWPLIEKVLSASHCVAVLGLCFGVMIAYLEHVWDHVLPFVKCSRLWRLEHARFEAQHLASLTTNRSQGESPDRSELENRAGRPQRWREMRNIAMTLELSDDPRKEEFETVVSHFPFDSLPFLWVEEQDDAMEVELLRERMEEFSAFGNRYYYHFERISEQTTGVKVLLPPHVERARRDRYSFLLEPQEAMALTSWAHRGIEKRMVPEGKTLAEAVAQAKGLAQQNDFTYSYEWRRDLQNSRHEAQVAVAALLAVTGWEWACDNDLCEWCLSLLSRATKAPLSYDPHYEDRPITIFTDDPKTYAARGWGALATHAERHQQSGETIPARMVREHLFQLAQLQGRAIWIAIFTELAPIWDEENPPVWLWELLNFAVVSSVVMQEEGDRWRLDARHQFQHGVVENIHSTLEVKNFPLKAQPTQTLTDTLDLIPLRKLKENDDAKIKLVHLVQYFVSITVEYFSNQKEKNRGRSPSWIQESFRTHQATEVLEWCVAVCDILDESQAEHLLVDPIWEQWATVPGLTEELLHAHITHWIRCESAPSATTQHTWRTLCLRVLGSQEVNVVSCSFSHRNIEAAVEHIVLQFAGSSWLEPPYPHASYFLDILDMWVKQVGYREIFFPKLLKLLETQAELLCPQPMLKWLTYCLERQKSTEAVKDSERVSRLVHRAFLLMQDEIASNEDQKKAFLFLIEPLISGGNPSAAWMREQIMRME